METFWRVWGRKEQPFIYSEVAFVREDRRCDGKPINVSDVSNWFNKKGWIRGYIQKGNSVYTIERTFSPSNLTIYKDDVALERSGMKNMQAIIDDEILDGLPYHIFSNVLNLSLNNFTSFISMSPEDKRTIIDRIFSLEIINEIQKIVKRRKSDTGNTLNIEESSLNKCEMHINNLNEQLSLASKESNVEELTNCLTKVKTEIQALSQSQASETERYTVLSREYNVLLENYNKLNALTKTQENDLKHINERIALFNQDKCPTCGASFNSAMFNDVKEQLENARKENEEILTKYQQQCSEAYTTSMEMYNEILSLSNNISKISSSIQNAQREQVALETKINTPNECSRIQELKKGMEVDIKTHEKTIRNLKKDIKKLSFMETMYSADGIKQTIMENYIPTLNAEIADTLNALRFPYNLEFDNAFNPHLEQLGVDAKSQNLSKGEHKKVDITVLCSLLKMIKRKYPQVNLVCLDETVSSLDDLSAKAVITYLKDISEEMDINIIIVSHTKLDDNLFDEHLFVEKSNGYSKLTKF